MRGMIGLMLMESALALLMIVVLLLLGYRRKDFFFSKGAPKSMARGSAGSAWIRASLEGIRPLVILIAVAVLLAFLIIFNHPSGYSGLRRSGPCLGVLLAALNAFNEETLWRRHSWRASFRRWKAPCPLDECGHFRLAHYLSGSPGASPVLS